MSEELSGREVLDFEGQLLLDVERWYESRRTKTGRVNTNVMTTGLMLSIYMADGLPMPPERYVSDGDSQLRKISGLKIRNVLAEHGEHRKFTVEGGRTSRGTLPLAHTLAALLNSEERLAEYSLLTKAERSGAAQKLEAWFAERIVIDFFNREMLKVEIDYRKPVQSAIRSLLTAAQVKGGSTAGALAQHLVGTALELEFPSNSVNSESYSSADQQTGRSGDYQIGDTAIHVTVSPSENLFSQRCRDNLNNGYRALVLVPTTAAIGAQQLAQVAGLAERVSVQSIETFIGTSLEAAAGFRTAEIRSNLRILLEAYNERVNRIEPDPSLRVRIPTNL